MRLPALVALLLAAPAAAVLPSEQLADTALESRARAISAQVRCVVCQNQSIDDSDAPLAHDLRVIVRERLTAGDSDAAAMRFLVDRYGHYVLLKPPVEPATFALWFAPAAVVLGGGVAVAMFVARKQRVPAAADLDAAEQVELDRLLKETHS